jgi:hypothetical protein
MRRLEMMLVHCNARSIRGPDFIHDAGFKDWHTVQLACRLQVKVVLGHGRQGDCRRH